MASRIYLDTVLGGLGGLTGWALFGILGEHGVSPDRMTAQLALGGALVGGAIGFFVTGSDVLRDRSPLRFFRAAACGLALGAVGGTAALITGERVYPWLLGHSVLGPPDGFRVVEYWGLSQAIGWIALGVAVGIGEGLVARSTRQVIVGAVGGVPGGVIGGSVFGLSTGYVASRSGNGDWWNALALVVAGAAIGFVSAVVQAISGRASVRVLSGRQEGREYPLTRRESWLGRDESADVSLFRDTRIERRHAVIRREGKRYVLENRDAVPAQTKVNGEPVTRARDLCDGDRIEIGGVLLQFRLRAARKWQPPEGT